jgi:hypothetical protein
VLTSNRTHPQPIEAKVFASEDRTSVAGEDCGQHAKAVLGFYKHFGSKDELILESGGELSRKWANGWLTPAGVRRVEICDGSQETFVPAMERCSGVLAICDVVASGDSLTPLESFLN